MGRPSQNNLTTKDIIAKETGTIIKKGAGNPSIALIYPNSYFVGMSNLGFQSLYSLFNSDSNCVCERVFLPTQKNNLRTFETNRLVSDSDCLAFSISFEIDYLNILPILSQAGIPLLAKERKENDPIVIAGGTAVTINPEPIRPFCDVVFIGEGEEAIPQITELLRSNISRSEKLNQLENITGCYVGANIQEQCTPSNQNKICIARPYPGTLNNRCSPEHLKQYKRAITKDINQYPTQTVIHTPYTEFGQSSLIELQRGCQYGCKFCAECFVATPFRERNPSLIKEQILEGLKHRNKIGLIGTNLLRYPGFIELCEFIHQHQGTFSPSSLRVDDITIPVIEQLKLSGHKTIAIAPEAGSDQLRHQLNKKITNKKILETINTLAEMGTPRIKIYLMIGLPGETSHDIEKTIDLIKNANNTLLAQAKKQGKLTKILLSINPFVPKPRTPFQNELFSGTQELKEKTNTIKRSLLPLGNIQINHESPFSSYIQALLANGSIAVSRFLINVFKENGNIKKALRDFTYEK